MEPVLDATRQLPPVPATPAATAAGTRRPRPRPRPGPVRERSGGPGRLAALVRIPPDRRALTMGGAAGLVVLLVLGGGTLLATRLHARPPATQTVQATTIAPASIRASASSTQRTDGEITYAAANTLDGTLASAWNSNGKKDGRGPGISLSYRFASAVHLRTITISNGYQKVRPKDGVDLWPLNERVRRFEVITDAGRWTWDLRDVRDPQTLRQDFGSTRTVQLQILAVYPSTKYLDVAVSEISFAAAP